MEKFFTSKAAMFVFALIHLDGAERLKLLGVEKKHYFKKATAQNWASKLKNELAQYTGEEKQTALDKVDYLLADMGW
jgi:hypothetical protein